MKTIVKQIAPTNQVSIGMIAPIVERAESTGIVAIQHQNGGVGVLTRANYRSGTYRFIAMLVGLTQRNGYGPEFITIEEALSWAVGHSPSFTVMYFENFSEFVLHFSIAKNR